MNGTIHSIFVTDTTGATPASVHSIRAVPGKGLEGDRYYHKAGHWSHNGNLPRDVTLVDIETLERVEKEYDIVIEPGEHRRNIETKGVDLSQLIGREFRIGYIALQGIRVCEPCAHLVDLTGKQPLLKGLVHSGLVAEILTDGVMNVGDQIQK
ncbi:MOSC domain-containing protein [Salicibibacter cibarius]|uniref:MOSC domain-containing protein n=1 Tax=Salicibibacter cibarius TaxID=2743000 RepID=A0A7T7CA09_9BACI|nr:MOSC domain-containing protein [Salicibibacter cibarius]QQK74417.1 MOSC domain-containing protein [Salicibibacter cibarius]